MDMQLIKDKHGVVIKAGDILKIKEPHIYVPSSFQTGESGEQYVRVELDIKTGELIADGKRLVDLAANKEYELELLHTTNDSDSNILI